MRRPNYSRLKKKPDRPGLEFGGRCNFRARPGAKILPALTGCRRIRDARQAAALDREHLDRRGPPAQLRWSQRFNDKIAARAHQAEQIGRHQQRAADLLAMLLQPRRDVHGVAEIGDLSARVSTFADYHRPGMRSRAKIRYQAELTPV